MLLSLLVHFPKTINVDSYIVFHMLDRIITYLIRRINKKVNALLTILLSYS